MSEPEDLVNQIRPNILAGEIGGRVRPSRRRIVRLHNDATTSGRARCRLVLKRQRRDRRLDYRPTRACTSAISSGLVPTAPRIVSHSARAMSPGSAPPLRAR